MDHLENVKGCSLFPSLIMLTDNRSQQFSSMEWSDL